MRIGSIRPQALVLIVAVAVVAYAIPKTWWLPATGAPQDDVLTLIGLVLTLGGAFAYYLASAQPQVAARVARVSHEIGFRRL